MRTEKEIDEVLKKLDEEMQEKVGADMPTEVTKLTWMVRITLLWVKGDLESLK